MEHNDFIEKTANLVQKAYDYNLIKRKQGDSKLYDCLDADALKARDIFELGMKLTADGADINYIDMVLSNMINMEKNNTARLYKIMQENAVLHIHDGINSWMLINMLLSFITEKERAEAQSHIKDAGLLELFKM